ncbi:hypothetical protein [Clostridium felsineum]|uniref:Uncharacterized protein n=1 Tax=Clostridium felsineum TaxID=36839 RepID=A0A1S8LDA4_9CLOT|nr:hypothetical protein [Clostridium felsineum]URZ05917.1 hypothetical protein CLROS_012490 [Clostridium felsineum]URZ10954.1 hypothetical protein CROST_016700 [Clostridium felsineum]
MGQYFEAINITKGEFVEPHDYDSFAGLTEHSYRQNNFMCAVEGLLQKGGAWYKDKIVWAGDYAESGLYTPEGYEGNLYDCASDGVLKKIEPKITTHLSEYLLNHDKKQFINMETLPSYDGGWILHPLSLLTAIGNGEGGGDFYTSDKKMLSYVGSWAGNSISAEDSVPVGYEEIKPNFVEV